MRAAAERGAVDTPGLVLVTGAALGIVWSLVRGNTAGWGSLEVLGTLIAGLVFAVLFVVWELRSREPMLPMRLFRSRAFASGNAVGFFMFASLFSAVFSSWRSSSRPRSGSRPWTRGFA